MIKTIAICFFTILATGVFGQLKVDAELRPRFEYRNGYKSLSTEDVDPASFISQRTRICTDYKKDKLKLNVTLQNIRVWGDVKQLNTNDKNGIAVHQAWGELLLHPEFSVKLGRQEIVYDDSRIFGNVGWAQQGRSHDAVILKYKKKTLKVDLGVAYNESAARLTGNSSVVGTYKTMQYLWLQKDWAAFSGSFLFLNNGLQPEGIVDETRYSQTIGTHLKSKGTVGLTANLYYQFGKDKADRDLSAYLIGVETNYKANAKIKLGLGVELQSGNSYDVESNDNKAFTPFYGTNHKFNGFMDYFYVGNHADNVGLLDIYAKANFKLGAKSTLAAFVHNFSGAADISASASRQLGAEIDLVYGYKVSDVIGVKAGYSQLFASESMALIKSGDTDTANNWAWLMVTVKPTLFQSSEKK